MTAKGRKPVVAQGRAWPVAGDLCGLPYSARTVCELAIAGKRDADEDPCRLAAKQIMRCCSRRSIYTSRDLMRNQFLPLSPEAKWPASR